jgi:hypothetical protein
MAAAKVVYHDRSQEKGMPDTNVTQAGSKNFW